MTVELSRSPSRLDFLHKPSTWVLLVAILYGVAQFIVLDPQLFLGWDEAMYVSQVSPFAEAVPFNQHRARGMTVIIAPVTFLTDSIAVLRIYLVAVSSAALFASFVVWCRIAGWAAPIGAALFGSTWMALFFGTQVLPNLWSAFVVVAAIGLAIRFIETDSTRELVGVAVLCALSSLIRPLDSVALVIGAFLVGLKSSRRHAMRLTLAAAVGWSIGMVEWFVESWVRFGGPVERMRGVRELVGGGLTNNIPEYLHLLDGPMVWSGRPDPTSRWAVLWIAILVILGLIGGLTGSDRRRRRTGGSAILCAALLATPYLLGADVAAPRFMLPALALLCLAAGVGLASALDVPRFRMISVPVLVLLLAFTVWWNAPIHADAMSDHVASGERVLALGAALRSRSPDGECFFLSTNGFPQISLASGCVGNRFSGNPQQEQTLIDTAAARGLEVFAIMRDESPVDLPAGSWECEVIESSSSSLWRLCALA